MIFGDQIDSVAGYEKRPLRPPQKIHSQQYRAMRRVVDLNVSVIVLSLQNDRGFCQGNDFLSAIRVGVGGGFDARDDTRLAGLRLGNLDESGKTRINYAEKFLGILKSVQTIA